MSEEGYNQHVESVADKFKGLRKALGLVHEDFVRLSDGKIARTEIVKIEGGENQLTGAKLRRLVALAIGLSTDDLADYLEGRANLADTLQRRASARRPPSVPPPADWHEISETTQQEARLLLRQPPQKFDPAAIELAFKRIRMKNAQEATDPSEVANAVRLYIWGVSATLSGATPSDAPRSGRVG